MSESSFTIDGRKVGRGAPCLVIAEIAQAHDGSLGMAHAYVDAASDAGADAVKFQTHIAAAESTPEEPWRVKGHQQDVSRYDYWKRMQFTETQWRGLCAHAQERGLLFLSSPFSHEAVELLRGIGVKAWKVASGEVSNGPLLRHLKRTELPVVLSTGASPLREIDEAVECLKGGSKGFAVLQCTSAYPCPPEKLGLNMMALFQKRYRCPVGLSDHSGTIYPALAATSLGAAVLEVHLTMSREMPGPDVPSSVTTAELRQMVNGIRFIEAALSHPVDKDRIAEELEPIRRLFMKSVVVRRDLPSGVSLRAEDLTAKKPGTGIPINQLDVLVGRRLARDVKADQILMETDLEPPSE